MKGERFYTSNVIELNRYGGGSVVVWAGINDKGKTELITVQVNQTAQIYCDEIILPVVVPFQKMDNIGLFQQNNTIPTLQDIQKMVYVKTM